MARVARRGEGGLHVVRIRGAVVILDVAGTAGAAGQVVISVGVTLRTLQSRVGAGQCKSHRVVVKSCRCPCVGVVASLASLRKVKRDVLGVRGFLVVG